VTREEIEQKMDELARQYVNNLSGLNLPGLQGLGARTKGGPRPCPSEIIHSCVIAVFLAGLPTGPGQVWVKTKLQKVKSVFSGRYQSLIFSRPTDAFFLSTMKDHPTGAF